MVAKAKKSPDRPVLIAQRELSQELTIPKTIKSKGHLL